jgi:hypothetical protein
MLKKSAFLIFFLSISSLVLLAQTEPTVKLPVDSTELTHYRISLLTCGPGEEVWETFGHACLRVIDSTRDDAERDKIYNYGFFEASEGNSIWSQAFSGRVVDLLDTITFEELMIEYRIKKRSITEQVLLLTEAQNRQVVAFLKKNLKRENRYYEFDTFYDNCSTRIRDLFGIVFGPRYKQGLAVGPESRLTFRDVTVTTLCPAQEKYWFGFAVNMLYASRTDKIMTSNEAMFLPVFLSKGLGNATIDGKALCAAPTIIQPETIEWVPKKNEPLLIILVICVLTLLSLFYRRLPVVGKITSTVFLVVTGLMGCLILKWWMMDGEPAWKDNFNLLWALPVNIIFPFLVPGIQKKYSLVGLVLIAMALVVHLLRIQVMPMVEVAPLMAVLTFIFAMKYRTISAMK